MIIKITIIRYLIIALAAFALGTFFPNPVAKNKAQGEAITWAKKLGFGPPKFEYSNDKEFISSLTNCINYLNFNIPRRERINTELIIAQAIVESDVFKNKCESVKYYIEILNTKRVYAEFRRVREVTLNRNPIAMAKTLDNFSTNKQYEKHVIEVILKLRNETK
jgi:flagellum-specific peptidoglycan hydrolase FlgJ